jgi:hypothetical protein
VSWGEFFAGEVRPGEVFEGRVMRISEEENRGLEGALEVVFDVVDLEVIV